MCLGKHNLTFTESSERCINISGIYRHEGFKYPTVPTVEFDIALVRLDEEVVPRNEISYACLPSEEEVLPGGKKCYATGWGDETGARSDLCSAHTSGLLVQIHVINCSLKGIFSLQKNVSGRCWKFLHSLHAICWTECGNT